MAKIKDPTQKPNTRLIPEKQFNEALSRRFIRNPLARKIEAMVDLDEFKSDPLWIAERLGASIKSVEDAIKLLLESGILCDIDGKLTSPHDHLHFFGRNESKDEARKNAIEIQRIMAHDLLPRLNPNDRFFVNTGIVVTDRETLSQFHKDYHEANRKFIKASQNSKKDLLVVHCIQAGNVLKQEEPKSLDKQLHELQLKQARAIAEIGNQVAHDIKSPLGSLDIALETINEKKEKSIEIMNQALERIKAIVEDLDNAKDAKIKEELKPKAVPLIQSLSSIIEEKKYEYFGSQIKMTFKHTVSEERYILGNEFEFGRIISNLLNNSVEAVDSDLGKIEVRLTEDDKAIRIQIIDNGHGIPSEHQKTIFLKGVSIDKEKGQGLGLTYAYEKLKSWGADLTLIESSEKGSTFEIAFLKK